MDSKQILETMKAIAEQVRQVDDRNLYGDVLSLQSDVMQLVHERNDLREVIAEKDRRIRELEDTADLSNRMKYEGRFWWLVDGEKKDGPFCQLCWDKDKKLIHLQARQDGRQDCFSCGKTFGEGRIPGSRERYAKTGI
jgi:hypothetical protein